MPKLVNVKLDLKVPGIGGIAGTWEPDESEVRAAWELYVEMVTRTPLGGFSSQDGSLRESLDSHLLSVRHHQKYPEAVWTHRGSAKGRAWAVLWVPRCLDAQSSSPPIPHGVAPKASQLGTNQSTPGRKCMGGTQRFPKRAEGHQRPASAVC